MTARMPYAGPLWFASGTLSACLLIGLAGVPLEDSSRDHAMIEWLTLHQPLRNQLEQTRRLNIQINAAANPSSDPSIPKHDRFPSRFPLAGQSEIGSGFGWRSHPFTGMPNLHEGLDLSAPAGMPILAAASGKVVKAGWHGGYGMLVEISHGRSLVTRYAHAQAIHVRPGDWVGQGQMIAEIGSTGHSTGPHLHFEIRLQGLALDPAIFVGRDARLSLR